MPSDVHHATYLLLPKYSRKTYARLMKSISNTFLHETNDTVKFRLHALTVYYHHGWKAVCDSLHISRGTLYNWKKVYETSGNKASSLIPHNTRPYIMRSMQTDTRIVLFIKAIREQYGNMSKYKIKPFLDAYTKEHHIPTVSNSTIGKIIKRRHFFFEAKLRVRRKRTYGVSRIKHAPKEKLPGYIQMDSITLYVPGQRYYFFSMIDMVTKYAWCTLTTSLFSHQAVIALKAWSQSYAQTIRTIQTDNGHEFLGAFHAYLEEIKINHAFIYPRSPKINGVVERFNRTIQEEFINKSEEFFCDIPLFNQKLVKYLTWYNTKRPHLSLHLQTPVDYLNTFTNIPICG